MTGNASGGIYVNKNFESLLNRLFGKPSVEIFRSKHPAEWIRLMQDFEREKKSNRAFNGKPTRILLPRKLMTMSGKTMSNKKCPDGVEISDGVYLCLRPEAMKDLFAAVTDDIVSHMKTLIKNPSLHRINYLILVGGFSNCQLLQKKIKEAAPTNCKVLVPSSADIAVLKGAVMYGKMPNVVSSRMMTTTYGFKWYVNFDSNIHSPDKLETIEGVAKCKDFFQVIVKQDESVKQGETKKFDAYPVRPDQDKVSFDFFTSTNPDVKYVTESSVKELTKTPLVVDSPDTSKGTNRQIELCLSFGGTEIKATAIDKSSGNTKVLYLKYWK